MQVTNKNTYKMMKIKLFILGILVSISSIHADEGMWMLPFLSELGITDSMQQLGAELTEEDIYRVNNSSLKDAVVIFGGGCTGEIISGEGLLLTNHHCGYDYVQEHSTVQNDYLKNGFWAMSKKEELVNPGLTVSFLVRIEEVTDQVLDSITEDMGLQAREAKIQSVGDSIAANASKGNHYDASVYSFYNGNRYFLMVYEVFKDVRLVGVPPSSIGKFGADTDNWMWPRHTGDFAFFRVYSGPDGKPAEYSEENIPLKPKHFLPISLKGVEEGDFSMVIGYPGGTQRYMTSYGVEALQEITHPNRIKIRGLRQEIWMRYMNKSDELRIKYHTKYFRSSNYWKFSIGQGERIEELNIIEKKKEQEDEFMKWVKQDSGRMEKYANVLDIIEGSLEQMAPYDHTIQYLMEGLYQSSDIINLATNTLGLRMQMEEGKKDGITQTLDQLKQLSKEHFKNYYLPADKEVTIAMLELFYKNVPDSMHPTLFKEIEKKYKGDFKRYAEKMYANSIFADQEAFNKFLDNPNLKDLKKDMAFQAAENIIQTYRMIWFAKETLKDFLEHGRKRYMQGLIQKDTGNIFYPDANFTMRLTYGSVEDYYPRDAVHYNYYTTLEGVMEKADPDDWEFVVPDKLKKLYKEKDFGQYASGEGYMPVCFISNNDITGGNSGSPVLNGKGHLIGVAFDGNWEAMSGDILYEPKLQRCISVDIRYVLFIVDKFAGAGYLLDEMSIIE